MKISELKEEFYAASGTVSEIVRQISFAGIAIIWVFKIGKEDSAGIAYTPEMRAPLLLFVAALFCDLLQYIYKTIIWWSLNAFHWNKLKNNDADVAVSGWWNSPTWAFFWLKAAFCLIAYFKLFSAIYEKIA